MTATYSAPHTYHLKRKSHQRSIAKNLSQISAVLLTLQKTAEEKKLKQEMILVWYILFLFFSNALRNDLQHPNEFVRASTLRFFCKLKDAEILEPLIHRLYRNILLLDIFLSR